jgi:LDH2 family malate/lactate/ureidoglycolate dehydrogenase
LPFGGHKGYALAVVTELLATALTGGPSIQPGNQRMGGVVNNMFTVLVDPCSSIPRVSPASTGSSARSTASSTM